MRPAVTAVLVALLAALAGCGSAGLASDRTPTGAVETPSTGTWGFEPVETVEVRVTRVVDGDTLEVRFPDGSEDTLTSSHR